MTKDVEFIKREILFFFFFLGSVKRDIYGTQLRKAMNLVQARTEEKCEDLLRCTLQLL